MLNVNYDGFTGTPARRTMKGQVDMRIAAVGNTIKKAAKELSDPSDIKCKKLFKKWFGEKRDGNNNLVFDPVIKRISMLAYAYEYATLRVSITNADRLTDCNPGDIAASTAPYIGQTVSMRNLQTFAGFDLTLCTDFFGLPIMGHAYHDRDTQLGTIMHEMTHMFAGTDDIGPSGVVDAADSYGGVNCINNAASHADNARLNADNYCYFLTQLYFRGY